ncbi:uroplakin-3b [Falco peregrinus]|uniref:uroplakin-3b n=1 Tax=Falco peregrinus TaxID=8954 RepID=UPI00247A30A8|nr:uroplakin-3b [Falco peregrinus]
MELLRVLLVLAGTGAAAGLALLPYVPRVPPAALPGKLTATTFALERPCCVFDHHTNASDAVWLVVAFANGEHPLLQRMLPAVARGRGGPPSQLLTPGLCHAASAAFRNPPTQADVPLYERLPTAHSYMTLETAASTYACSAPGWALLRVGGDTACGGQGSQDPCNGPLPSPGPYRVKFLVMGCHGPKAETRWSEPILLPRGTGGTAVLRVPTPAPLGCWHAAWHQPYAITPKPRGEKRSPNSPGRPPLSIAPSLNPPCPPHIPHPTSFQPATPAPSTPHPHAVAAT